MTKWTHAEVQQRKQSVDSMADVVDALTVEFEPVVEMSTVVRVVRHCRRELDIAGYVSTGMLHTRARGRLRDLVAAKRTPPGVTVPATTPAHPYWVSA